MVQHATSALKHKEIAGHVQLRRGGFGLVALTSERRKMVVEEVHHQGEAERSAKAVSLAKQGQWIRVGRSGEEKAQLEAVLGNGVK